MEVYKIENNDRHGGCLEDTLFVEKAKKIDQSVTKITN